MGRLLPGNTANPHGRPPGSLSLIGLLKKHLEEVPDGEKRTRAELFIQKTLAKAMKGDPGSEKLVWNYIEGLPKSSLDITSDGKPLPILGNVPTHTSDRENPEPPQAD